MKPVLPCGKEPGQLLKDNPGLGKKSEKGMLGGGRKKRDERKSGRFGGSLEREGRGQSGKHRHYLTVAFTVKSLLTGQGQESQESQQHQVNGLRVQGLALHPR